MSDTILLGLPDHRKLSGIVAAMKARRVALAPHLQRLDGELKQAQVVGEPELPENVVGIGSTVLFKDEATSERHRVRIVFPADLDGTEGTTSVMSPLGCALIGEREGTSLSCQTPSGERLIRVLMVTR